MTPWEVLSILDALEKIAISLNEVEFDSINEKVFHTLSSRVKEKLQYDSCAILARKCTINSTRRSSTHWI